MSSIFKLSIKGVRSFDPIETETIEFNKPLTLIVGSNGSGKTTIIECLKFATTGDLPPNSKGGAFIHDPNIGGEKSVIAQIKLAFNNINDKNMILTKTLQLISKKTTNTFKTLENQLVVLNNGERVTISTKAADVEQLVPQFLGVTKSILNYVIFCHQEDSLWPISEPAVLKKRFDEIFDSVKFIKVLDNFKELRKQFTDDIKLLTNNVEHLKQDRRRANNKRMEKEDLEVTVEKYTEEIDVISKNLQEVSAKMESLFKSNQDYELVINKIELLQQQNKSLRSQITKLKDTIDFLPDSDNELQNKLTNFNDIQSLQREKINELRSEADQINQKLLQRRKDYNVSIGLEGELKSLKTLYEKNSLERQSLMEKNDLGLIITDEITETLVEEYKTTLNKLTTLNEKKLQKLIEENSVVKQRYEKNLQLIRDNSMKEVQHLKYYSEDIKNYQNINQQIDQSIKAIGVDEGDLVLDKEQLNRLKLDFANLKQENKIVTLSSDISAANKEILSLESDIEDLNHQISNSNKQSETVTRVSFLKEQMTNNAKKISIFMKDNSENFEQKTGKQLTISDCTLILTDTIKSKILNLDDEIMNLDMLNQEHYELSSLIQKLQLELDGKQEELQSKLQKIHSILPDDVSLVDYEEYCKDLQVDLDTLSENINITEVTVKFNEAAINSATKDHYCLLCRRGFEEKEVSVFLTMLKEHNDKIKTGSDTKERDSMRKELEELKELQYDVSRVRVLQDGEQQETSKLKEFKDNLTKLESKLQEQKLFVENSKRDVISLESMNNFARELERLNREQKSYEEQLNSLQDELYGVEIKSISSLQKEQQDISLKLKQKRKELSDLFESKEEYTKQMNRLELKIKEKTLTIANREKELIDLKNLKKQKDENEDKLTKLNDTVTKSEKLVEELELELQKQNEEYSQMKLQVHSKELEQQQLYNGYQKLLENFQNLNVAIEQFMKYDSNRLEECSENLKKLDVEIHDLESHIENKNIEISQLEKELIDANRTLRNIRDNIDIRSLELEFEQNSIQINELEEQNARTDRDNYLKETNELNQKSSNLKSEHLMKTGEILQLTKQIKSIEIELVKDYQDIDRKYNEEFLRLRTKFLVNNDLSVYSKLLDSAIMKFHSLKMREINEIIDQLWRTTYSGSDVDTILIKSESNTVGVKSGNRSYNYRVVMVKQGVELDMRGRCSAGQKVLASIIIRLALLECFGINFGMITLDEPTTNLDEDNIESLAKSLNQIIEMRQRQKNFQLIVITHDEKFLKHMGAAKFTDLYYRVSRSERQTSVIEAVPIAVIND